MEIKLEFGAIHGGFRLTFGQPVAGESHVLSFGEGSLEADVLAGPVPRMRCVRSAWERGGLPLRMLFRQPTVAQSVCGVHLVEPPFFTIGPVQLWQAQDHVALWLGHGRDLPRPHWPRVAADEIGLSVWFSSQTVRMGSLLPGVTEGGQVSLLAGLAIPVRHLPEDEPVDMMAIVSSDFG